MSIQTISTEFIGVGYLVLRCKIVSALVGWLIPKAIAFFLKRYLISTAVILITQPYKHWWTEKCSEGTTCENCYKKKL